MRIRKRHIDRMRLSGDAGTTRRVLVETIGCSAALHSGRSGGWERERLASSRSRVLPVEMETLNYISSSIYTRGNFDFLRFGRAFGVTRVPSTGFNRTSTLNPIKPPHTLRTSPASESFQHFQNRRKQRFEIQLLERVLDLMGRIFILSWWYTSFAVVPSQPDGAANF